MNKIIVSAPGKLHLLGEHAIVYGKPAILAAINKRTTATIKKIKEKEIRLIILAPSRHSREGGNLLLRHPEFISGSRHISLTPDLILDRTTHAREVWQLFQKNGNSTQLKQLTIDPLQFILFCIGETAMYYNKKLPNGFSIEITSDIPMGSGMGSSASVAVAVAGAVSRLLNKPLDKKIINEIAFNTEKLIHGNPSGGDNSTCTYGGLLWYRKETQDLKIIQPLPFSLSQNLIDKFSVIFTGKPEESTGEMVAKIKNQKSKFKNKINKILNEQEELTKELLGALKNEDIGELKRIIMLGEKNLEALGVVSESTKQLIREVEKIGGVAKICGAGGAKKSSGVVLAFHENRKVLESLLQSQQLAYATIRLGEEGVREE